MREPETFEYSGSALITGWFGVLPNDVFVCQCGWRGMTTELSVGWHEEVIDGSCRLCDTILLVRPYGATKREIRDAARRGDPEAIQMLREDEVATSERPADKAASSSPGEAE